MKAQRRNWRYSSTLSFNLGAIYGWVINTTPRPLYPRETDTLPIVQEARWASGSVWMATKYVAHTGFRTLDRPARKV